MKICHRMRHRSNTIDCSKIYLVELQGVMASFKTIKPLKSNTMVKRLSLMVSSNGVRTQKLNIQFPARWPQQSEDLGLKVYRMRQGKMIDTTSQENLFITSKNMYAYTVPI